MSNRTVPAAAEGMLGRPRTYKVAFERLEAPISNLVLISKTQRVLLDRIFPGCEAQHLTGEENEAICHVASLVYQIAAELDELWLDTHNEGGATVTDSCFVEPVAARNEHSVSLHRREGEADSLTAITDAVHSAQNLIGGLTAINLEAPHKVVVNAFWTGLTVVASAMDDVSARLEAELDRRAGR